MCVRFWERSWPVVVCLMRYDRGVPIIKFQIFLNANLLRAVTDKRDTVCCGGVIVDVSQMWIWREKKNKSILLASLQTPIYLELEATLFPSAMELSLKYFWGTLIRRRALRVLTTACDFTYLKNHLHCVLIGFPRVSASETLSSQKS